ncbi:PITH domain-containing protein At3g04780 [Linum grandiflorum]
MSSTAPATASSAIQRNQVDLVDFVDWSGVECLNYNSAHPIANALKQVMILLGFCFELLKQGYREDDGLNLESDADEQLLIYIPFNQVVKLHSIALKGPEEEGPKTVKLFSNKEHMGFSNVNDYPPSDTIVLSEDGVQGKPVALKYVKFQNVRSVTIFIEDNQAGGDVTKVQKIAFFGSTVETTDMKGLKKIEDH